MPVLQATGRIDSGIVSGCSEHGIVCVGGLLLRDLQVSGFFHLYRFTFIKY
jgi:hypothetical protein